MLDFMAVGDYKKPFQPNSINMPYLYITIANPKNYGKFFPADPKLLSSEDLDAFKNTAIHFLESSITMTALLAGIPVERLPETGIPIMDGLEKTGTAYQAIYADTIVGQKDIVENTLVYKFEDGVDLSIFETDPEKLVTIEIPYPKGAEEGLTPLTVTCIASKP